MEPRVVVTEIAFKRDASSDDLRRLGQALEACKASNDWIAEIGGLAALLQGEAPKSFSKAILISTSSEMLPMFDPVLVWAYQNYPGAAQIDPVGILRAAIPRELGTVNYPDPDGGI
jgi:hypothetical protein